MDTNDSAERVSIDALLTDYRNIMAGIAWREGRVETIQRRVSELYDVAADLEGRIRAEVGEQIEAACFCTAEASDAGDSAEGVSLTLDRSGSYVFRLDSGSSGSASFDLSGCAWFGMR